MDFCAKAQMDFVQKLLYTTAFYFDKTYMEKELSGFCPQIFMAADEQN